MTYIIEHIGEILITGVLVLYLFNYVIYEVEYKEQQGIFNIMGEVPTDEEWDTKEHKEPENLNDMLTFKHPSISLTGEIYQTSTDIKYKEIFSLYFDDGTELPGTDTSGVFRVVMKDVILNGGSVFLEKTKEQMNESDEVFVPMYYDPETECLHFYSAGAYTMLVEIKYPNGVDATYSISIPVETKR